MEVPSMRPVASPFDDDGMREDVTAASPAELDLRNVFTEDRPLRRARSGRKPL
jgi:hypothetical protein